MSVTRPMSHVPSFTCSSSSPCRVLRYCNFHFHSCTISTNNTAVFYVRDAPCQIIILAPGIDRQSSTSRVTVGLEARTARVQTGQIARGSVLRYVQRRRTLLAGIGVARGRRRVLDDVRLLLLLVEGVGDVCSKHWLVSKGLVSRQKSKVRHHDSGSRLSGRDVWTCWLFGRGGVEGGRRTIVHGGRRSHRLASGWPSSLLEVQAARGGRQSNAVLPGARKLVHTFTCQRVKGDTSAARICPDTAVRRGARIDSVTR